jgi:uncharacterized protein YeaO (DUF488 family)
LSDRDLDPRGFGPMFRIKRVYEPPAPEDGTRILVDRLWPRGLTKEAAHVVAWRKELSPSNELRRWYAHDPERYEGFRERYRGELRPHQAELAELAAQGKRGTVTLVFSSKEGRLSNAAVLKEFLDELAS